MLISAPDTPYGAAFVHFWQVFARRPLHLPRLREAFAALGECALHAQPPLPWPTTIRTGTGTQIPFTVEALLAEFARKSTYASRPAVSDATIQDYLLRWTNATIKEVVPGWQGAGFQVQLAKKIRLASTRTRTQDVGGFGVSCTWQLLQEQHLVCSSNDTDSHLAKALRILRGKKLLSSQLSAGGGLLLSLQAGFRLTIAPDHFAISADYFLDFGWDDQHWLHYDCFEGAFSAPTPPDGAQDILGDS
jgi:hypothetical protein